MSSGRPLARIDLAAIRHNFAEVRRLVPAATDVIAMVKADAYGHGAEAVVRVLAAAGCRSFGVATLEEAAELGTSVGRVVMFGGLLPADAARAVALGVESIVYDHETLDALDRAAVAAQSRARVHLHVDTGMHRLGATPDAVAGLLAHARRLEGIELLAVCSHFACAESEDSGLTGVQLAALRAAADVSPPSALHAANSAAIIAKPETHMDAVRPGLMLYGLYPSPAQRGLVDLRPAMTLDAAVVRVAEVGPGEGIGYGHSYRTRVRTRVATLRIGYADGYPRALSNRGRVLIHGRSAPVVGRVCMDHVMVDASEIADVGVGDRALLWGPGLPAEQVADLAGTIAYELVSRVGTRVARVYEEDEEEDS